MMKSVLHLVMFCWHLAARVKVISCHLNRTLSVTAKLNGVYRGSHEKNAYNSCKKEKYRFHRAHVKCSCYYSLVNFHLNRRWMSLGKKTDTIEKHPEILCGQN